TPEHTDALWCGLQAKARAGTLSVSSIQPGSPASKAGLCESDEILQVNGETPANLISFNRLLCSSTNHEPRLTISRGGERRSVRVHMLPFKEVVPQKLGLTLTEPSDQAVAGLNLRQGESLLIDSVEKNGPADKANLQRGFLMTGIEGQSVSDFKSVGEMV